MNTALIQCINLHTVIDYEKMLRERWIIVVAEIERKKMSWMKHKGGGKDQLEDEKYH